MEIVQKPKRRKPRIDFIPVINVVFLLLIFFMVQGTIKTQDPLPIEVPESETGKQIDENQIEILVGTYELIYRLDLVTDGELEMRLKADLARNPDEEIMLKADHSLSSSRMLEIVEIIKAAGGKKVSIVTSKAR